MGSALQQTVYGYFRQWSARGVIERILDELREQLRLAEDAELPSGGDRLTLRPIPAG